MSGVRVEWLQQRTEEWHNFRARGGPGNPYPCAIGASEASTVMGEAEGPDDALRELFARKLGLRPEKEANYAMERGRKAEPAMMEWLCGFTHQEFEPAVFYRDDKPWLIASVDAVNNDRGLVAEFKLCRAVDHLQVQTGTVPRRYRGQLQHILNVTGMPAILLVVLGWQEIEPVHLWVHADRFYIEKLEERAEAFCRAVRDGSLDLSVFLRKEAYMPEQRELFPDFTPDAVALDSPEVKQAEAIVVVEDAMVAIPILGETREIVLADHWVAQRDEWVREALELQVRDKSTADHAGILINAMTTFRKRIEEAKKLTKSPYKMILDSIEETVKGLLAPAIVAEVALNKKLTEYIDRATAERRAAEAAAAKLTATARANGASALEIASKAAAMAIALPEPAKPVGVASKRAVSFEIVDEGKVERKYCSPDEAKLRAAVKLLEKVYGEEIPEGSIPGVKIWFETRVQKH